MGIRRLLAVVLIATILGTGVAAPPKAEAVETAVIVVGSIVAWFGIVVLATYLIRHTDSSFAQSSESPLIDGQKFMLRPVEEPKVRFGEGCARLAEGPSLVCW